MRKSTYKPIAKDSQFLSWKQNGKNKLVTITGYAPQLWKAGYDVNISHWETKKEMRQRLVPSGVPRLLNDARLAHTSTKKGALGIAKSYMRGN